MGIRAHGPEVTDPLLAPNSPKDQGKPRHASSSSVDCNVLASVLAMPVAHRQTDRQRNALEGIPFAAL